ncbi:MAG TPA: hypothetical protein VLS90_15010, partial [Thermodesulfobacteriota bacterium]|nr:hypothetical protein [Thermodesulfobacteriota bacterium]
MAPLSFVKRHLAAISRAGKVSGAEVLRLEGIVKEFPGVKALDNVTFDLRPQEVHVLLGENGAG